MNLNMSWKFFYIAVVVSITGFVGIAGYFFVKQEFFPAPVFLSSSPTSTPVACSGEAKLCLNGSYVSRIGPDCEFAACPAAPFTTSTPTSAPDSVKTKIILSEGQREGPFLLEKIYSDRVEGLRFWEYPVATEKGSPMTLHIGEDVSNGCTITLKLVKIEKDSAVFLKKEDSNRPCPICLSGHTLIDVPLGRVLVKDLKDGDSVWTVDKSGRRISGIVLKTSKTSVSLTHKMVHLILSDGRELLASPGHPTVDGRVIGDLAPGNVYNGANVLSAERVPYNENVTYDILPSGGTGFYWANGIFVGSTLR